MRLVEITNSSHRDFKRVEKTKVFLQTGTKDWVIMTFIFSREGQDTRLKCESKGPVISNV